MDQAIWTGGKVTALRHAYRTMIPELSDEEFASSYLKVSPRTIYDWAQKPDTVLRPATQGLLKQFFADSPAPVKRKYIEFIGSAEGGGTRAGTGTSDAQLFSPAQINALSASEDLAAMHAFRAADLQVGGGHLYASVVKYLKQNLAPRLFDVSAPTSTPILFSAASGLSEMAGWMSHDAGRDGAARSHFLQALDYAKYAGDAQLTAHVLGSLAHLSDHLGLCEEALRFSRQGRQVLSRVSSPPLKSRLLALEARAMASAGDSSECAKLLIAAERVLTEAAADEPSAWVSNFDEASLASETCVRCDN